MKKQRRQQEWLIASLDWTKRPNDNLFWLHEFLNVCWAIESKYFRSISMDYICPTYEIEDFLE